MPIASESEAQYNPPRYNEPDATTSACIHTQPTRPVIAKSMAAGGGTQPAQSHGLGPREQKRVVVHKRKHVTSAISHPSLQRLTKGQTPPS